jgi:hypothetical protein
MGKNAPTPPTPIDPVATANAQSASNIATATQQQKLNLINSSTPYGSVTYNQDANSPGGYTQNVSLSADQQQMYNSMTNAQKLALGLTQDQIGRVQTALESNPHSPNLQMSLDYQGNPINPGAIVSGVGTPQLNGTIGAAGNQQTSFSGSGPLQTGINTSNQFQTGFNNGGNVGTSIGGVDPITKTFNPGNTSVTSSIAPQGAIANGYSTPGGMQSSINTGSPLQNTFQNTSVQGSIGPTDFTADRNAVTNSVWQQALSRLDPQYGQAQNSLDVKLANQGIGINSAAYGNAQDVLGRQKNDAYNQALYSGIQQGANEQNTLFNQSLQQGQFANQAAGQQYAQNQGLAQFGNEASLADFNRNLQAGQFGNQAQQQAYAQNQQSAQFQNQAQQQGYEQAMGGADLQNAAAAQQFAQNQNLAAFQNQAQSQGYNQALGTAQFGNQAQAQQFGENQTQADFHNQALTQDTTRQIAAMQAANEAQGQQFNQNQAQAQFTNQAQAQQFAQEQARQQAQNQAALQQFQMAYANGQLNNQAQAQQYAQMLGMDQNTFNKALQQAQFGNTAANQNFANQMQSSNLPINQLAALLGLGQVQLPTGPGYTPTQVAPTDVMGAVGLNAQQQQAAYNAQLQQQQSMLSGLFGLGGAAITAFSDARLKRDVKKVATRPDGLGVYLFRYLWSEIVHLGVMAQEVLWVKPEAVVRDASGFLAVDYGQLEMGTV